MVMPWRGTEHWRHPSTLPAATAPQRVPAPQRCHHHHCALSSDLVQAHEHTFMFPNLQDPIKQTPSPCSVHPMVGQSSQVLPRSPTRLSHSTVQAGQAGVRWMGFEKVQGFGKVPTAPGVQELGEHSSTQGAQGDP